MESIASTDTVKIEEGVPVDAQTLGRASGVIHRQCKFNILNPKQIFQFSMLQPSWQEGG